MLRADGATICLQPVVAESRYECRFNRVLYRVTAEPFASGIKAHIDVMRPHFAAPCTKSVNPTVLGA